MKILYLDMDGVIADFDAYIQAKFPGFNGLSQQDKEDAVDEVCLNNRDIFHTLTPIKGAIESATELNKHFELYFLSTPMWTVPESFTGKRIWIENHFGVMGTKKLILTHRKDLNMGDFLVDDRLHNGAGKFTGEHIHFGQAKFPDWETTLPYLLANK